ncbi:MAG: aromatic-ring-hydroxylating dioxygenase subunit beta [Candidatus Binatia bacterium]
MGIKRQQIEGFIYREARLMDEHRYDEWLALWTDDAVYWVPSNNDELDPMQSVSIIYDDRGRISDRINRLKSGMAYAQKPPSRMRRVVSNLEVEEGGNDEVTVYSNFVLTEIRRGIRNIWSGRTVHRLRMENGDLKMGFKKVLLLENDTEIPSLVFLI